MCKYHNPYSEWLKQKQKKKGGAVFIFKKEKKKGIY